MNDGAKLEGVSLIFRNFAGEERTFNPSGNRNFSVVLDEGTANAMLQDGWSVKALDPREEGDKPTYYLKVRVSYKGRPPKIVMVTDGGNKQTPLNENTVSVLDWAEITNCDLIVRPYEWEVNGKSGVTAYLKTMYVTIYEDELEKKYAMKDEGEL